MRQELLTDKRAVKIVLLTSARVIPGTRPAFFRHAGNGLADIGNLPPICALTRKVKRSECRARPVIARSAENAPASSEFVGGSLCNLNLQFDSRQLRDTGARRKIKLTNKLRD